MIDYNEKDAVDVMSIRSLFMKEIVSRALTKKLKKNVSDSCKLTLTDFVISQGEGDIVLDTELHLEMSSIDFKKLLLKKNLI